MKKANRSEIVNTSGVFSQSFAVRMNVEKRERVLRQQRKLLSMWKKKEIKYVNKFLVIHNFTQQELRGFEGAEFRVEGDYDLRCRVVSEWMELVEKADPKGLELSGVMIRPKLKLRLRSIACMVKMKVKMSGDCDFFIVSRNKGNIENFSPFVKISRDTSLNGIFVMFGNVNTDGNIVFMKQVQVPEERQGLNDRDFSKLDIDFCDNGDNKVFVRIEGYGKEERVKTFNTLCDMFLPFFEVSKLLIGGSGGSIRLKNLSVQQRERVVSEENEMEKACRCVLW